MVDRRAIILAIALLFILTAVAFSGCLEQKIINEKPVILIKYPSDGARVSGIFTISGTATDPDGNDSLLSIEVRIDNGEWKQAYGSSKWSFEIDTTQYENGEHEIQARAYDNVSYSDVASLNIYIDSWDEYQNVHRWAVFAASANRPDIKTKLGNGGLVLAEEMARYFIEHYSYPASHITILFDDGWIRDKNGEGERISTLQERGDRISGVSYGAATLNNIKQVLAGVIDKANAYDDSEVFIWMFNHGIGDEEKKYTGGKILEHSELILWDGVMSDDELGEILSPLHAKLCLIVDACYSGGFANRIIFNIPTLLNSKLPANGRIIITGTSKFTKGYASTTSGPLFTYLWFTGIKTGDADGFRAGLFERGRPTHLRFFKDGKVSVEEAFYFARYMLTTKEFRDYMWMQPQMSDRYPGNPPFRNRGEMLLGT